MTKEPDPLDAFDEAIASFRARVPMTEEEWKALTAEARQYAFKIARVSQADVLSQVWLHLDDAIANGATYGEFAQAVQPVLESEWAGSVAAPAFRVETIFRTNVQTAYSAGTWAQMQHPAIKKARPYVRSQTIGDQRQSDICAAIGTVILPADHPWWNTHWSPLHFNCRRRQVSLSEAQAKSQGITGSPPDTQSAKGFGRQPTGFPKADADHSDYPPEIAKVLDDDERSRGTGEDDTQ